MSKFCESCEAENALEAKFCRKCGSNEFNESKVFSQTDTNEQIKTDRNRENDSELNKLKFKKFLLVFLVSLALWFIFTLAYFQVYISDEEQISIPFFGHIFFTVVNLADNPLIQVSIPSLMAGIVSIFIPYDSKLKYFSFAFAVSLLFVVLLGIYLYGVEDLFLRKLL